MWIKRCYKAILTILICLFGKLFQNSLLIGLQCVYVEPGSSFSEDFSGCVNLQIHSLLNALWVCRGCVQWGASLKACVWSKRATLLWNKQRFMFYLQDDVLLMFIFYIGKTGLKMSCFFDSTPKPPPKKQDTANTVNAYVLQ